MKEYVTLLENPVFPNQYLGKSIKTLSRDLIATGDLAKRSDMIARIEYLSRLKDLMSTIISISSRYDIPLPELSKIAVTQSDVAPSIQKTGVPSDVVRDANLTDIMGDTENITTPPVIPVPPSVQEETIKLQEFFSRPIEINSGSFPIDTQVKHVYRVWADYTIKPSVRAKLRNYAYLRGNLHVRISISGTPFHYGRVIASYQPYPDKNETLDAIEDWRTAHPLNSSCLECYLTQSPECIVMDVTENKPYEMVLPFIHHKPMARLWNTSVVVSDTTHFTDFYTMGSLYFMTHNVVSSSNDTASEVNFSIYAWMENVQLGTLTGTQIDIRTEADEMETGPVEMFSSGAAQISNALSNIPIIAPYMRASHAAMTKMKEIAAHFGWSQPHIPSDPKYVKNVPYQNGSNTIGMDTGFKITLDPKQELVSDPRIMSYDEDDMVIAAIAARPAFQNSFGWNVADDLFTPIYYSAVTPSLENVTNITNGELRVQTPMSFAAFPFNAWRGDIYFTFDIVCNQFMRGKLMFGYDPNNAQSTLILSSVDLDKQFTKIIDIQETRTVTLCVPWAHYRDWCRTKYTGGTVPSYGPGVIDISTEPDRFNGFIFVAPFTKLVAPDGVDSIPIHVYVKCENLMVNRFININFQDKLASAESAFMDIDYNTLSTQPVSCFPLNESTADSSTICQDHYGERPVSFRSVLKRFTKSTKYVHTTGTFSPSCVRFFSNIRPYQRAVGSSSFNETTLFEWLRRSYVGFRGGIRWRVRSYSLNPLPYGGMVVSLATDETSYATAPAGANNDATSTTLDATTNHGSVVFTVESNAGIEFECPFYSRNLYHYAFTRNEVGTNSNDNMTELFARRFTIVEILSSTAGETIAYNLDFATGEDFSFFRFQGAPFITTT